MPLYEYKCLKCGRRTEKIENVSGPHLKKCPHCSGKLEQMISAPAIQFKGTGWYVTDYAGKSGGNAGGREEKQADDKKTTEKSDSEKKDSSKDSSTKESSSGASSKDSSSKEKKSEKSEKSAKKK